MLCKCFTRGELVSKGIIGNQEAYLIMILGVGGARPQVEHTGFSHFLPRGDLELLFVSASLCSYTTYVSHFLEIQLEDEIVMYSKERTVHYKVLVLISVPEFTSSHLIAATHLPPF